MRQGQKGHEVGGKHAGNGGAKATRTAQRYRLILCQNWTALERKTRDDSKPIVDAKILYSSL